MMLDLFRSEELIAGLRWGLLAVGVGLPAGLAWRARFGKAGPLHGILVAAAFVAAIAVARPNGQSLLVAIMLLVVGGFLQLALRLHWVWAPVLALPGAWLLAFETELPGETWAPWLLLFVVVLSAPLFTVFDHLDLARGCGPWLWLLSVAGIFVGVPDTEEALVLLGVSAPLALLGWPLRLIHIGSGAFSMPGLFMWVSAWGGRGNPAAMVAMIAGLGLFVIEPVLRAANGHSLPADTRATIAATSVHLVIVVLVSRWAATYSSVTTAALLGGLILAIGALGLRFLQTTISR